MLCSLARGLHLLRAMKLAWSVRLVLVALAGMFMVQGVAIASPIVFALGADPVQDYLGEDVGPYPGALTHSTATGFFCLDENLASSFNTRYSGTVAAPNSWQEQEAAFLAAVAIHLEGQNGNHAADGPISFAIWQVMGTNSQTDPAAAPYVQMAEFAYSHHMISATLLQQVEIFTPSEAGIQRFISGVANFPDVSAVQDAMANQVAADLVSDAPEPSTFLFGGTALGIVMTMARKNRVRLKV